MKRTVLLLLSLALMLSVFAAQAAGAYTLGDTMEDFAVVLSDGSEVTLYGLLAEKKAVLLNLWASWCPPCRREFPAMQAAYDAASDDIGILALDVEPTDTDETIRALMLELGLTTLPMGRDTADLASRFRVSAVPTSVMVDRNGVICFIEAGAIPDAQTFLRLFAAFTAEDYETQLLTRIPDARYGGAWPAPEALAAALGDSALSVSCPGAASWPFLPDEEGVFAAGSAVRGSTSVLTAQVTAKEGDALVFGLRMTCDEMSDILAVQVDGVTAARCTGRFDWREELVELTPGAHEVTFRFSRGMYSGAEDAGAFLRQLRVADADEAAPLRAAQDDYPRALTGAQMNIGIAEGDMRDILIANSDAALYGAPLTIGLIDAPRYVARITVGPDVDIRVAGVVTSQGDSVLLRDLPHDGQGFLYDGGSDGSGLVALATFHDLEGEIAQANDGYLAFFLTEEGVDEYLTQLVLSAGLAPETVGFHWSYVDGGAKRTDDAQRAYSILVTDEAGAPVPGVLLQLCDESTCQVLQLDEEGRYAFTSAPCAWEVHVLSVPEGYALPGDVYVLDSAGQALFITLTRP